MALFETSSIGKSVLPLCLLCVLLQYVCSGCYRRVGCYLYFTSTAVTLFLLCTPIQIRGDKKRFWRDRKFPNAYLCVTSRRIHFLMTILVPVFVCVPAETACEINVSVKTYSPYSSIVIWHDYWISTVYFFLSILANEPHFFKLLMKTQQFWWTVYF